MAEQRVARMVEVIQRISTVVVGKEMEIRLAVTCLLAGGHLLLDGIPGMGKTTLSKALALVLGYPITRVQFTSDLLPADILGGSVYDARNDKFEFHRGPIFTNVLLADEINRASPRTQSALLEAMEEQQVSAEGVTHQLPDPFLVIATQNPLNHTGTFPLPESQLDRFMMRIFMGYPTASEEIDILLGKTGHLLVADLQSVMPPEEFKSAQAAVRLVRVERRLAQYVQSIAAETRKNEAFVEGVSPRGAQSLLKAAKAWGFMEGRDYVRPEDVRAVAPAVLSHRLELKQGQKSDAVRHIESMLSSVHV